MEKKVFIRKKEFIKYREECGISDHNGTVIYGNPGTYGQFCGAGVGGAEIIWDMEPEPKLNFYFLQSVWRMLR